MTGQPSSPLGYAPCGRQDPEAAPLLALGDHRHPVGEWIAPLAEHFAIRSIEAPRRADPRRFGVATASGDWYVEGPDGPDPDALSCDLSRPRGAAPADAKDAETPRRSATAETQERFLTQRTTNYVSASRSGQQQKPRIQPRELRCSPAA